MTLRAPIAVTAALLGAAMLAGCTPPPSGSYLTETAQILTDLVGQMTDGYRLSYTASYTTTAQVDGLTLVRQAPTVAYLSDMGRFVVTPEKLILCDPDPPAAVCHRAPNTAPGAIGAQPEVAALNTIGGPSFISPEQVQTLIAAAAVMPTVQATLRTRVIATQDSRCVDVSGIEPTGPADERALHDFSVCVTNDGVLASFRGTIGSDRRSVELSRLRRTVEPSTLAPPAGADVVDVAQLPI